MHSQFNYDTSTEKIQIRELHITLQTKIADLDIIGEK